MNIVLLFKSSNGNLDRGQTKEMAGITRTDLVNRRISDSGMSCVSCYQGSHALVSSLHMS
uniref:Uncharacterized protein n=1 Tax=Rhizophora mucronata TaxID=61149 RepID=A0A2P2IPY7_RHIMU